MKMRDDVLLLLDEEEVELLQDQQNQFSKLDLKSFEQLLLGVRERLKNAIV